MFYCNDIKFKKIVIRCQLCHKHVLNASLNSNALQSVKRFIFTSVEKCENDGHLRIIKQERYSKGR